MTYDVAVVGGGTAGAVVASRLSEGGRLRVVLFEAGSAEMAPELHGPSFSAAMSVPGRIWPGYLRGHGLGGSSAINGMVAERGSAGDYDGWGLPGWGWADVEPWFDRLPVPLHEAAVHGPLAAGLLAADPAARLALLTRTADGRRASTADVYLHNAACEVRSDARVERIVLDGRRACGVHLADGTEIGAATVVVCAGAINSPLLLRASGIDADGIGENLQDHVGVAIPVMLHAAVPAAAPDIAVVTRAGDLQMLAVDRVHGERGLGLLVAGVLRTHTRGTVRPDGVDFGLDRRDLDALAEARRLAAHTLAHPAMRAACTRLESEAEWSERAVYHHAAGTCAMGAVVDTAGAVRGWERLYVCDASVLPVLPAAGTLLPTIMLAERLASALRRRLEPSSPPPSSPSPS